MIHTFSTQPRRTGLGLATLGLAALALTAAHPAAAQSKIYNFEVGGAVNSPTYTGVGVLGNSGALTSTFNREVSVGPSTAQVGGGSGGPVYDSNGIADNSVTFNYDANQLGTSGAYATGADGDLLSTFVYGNAFTHISLKGLAPNTAFTACFYGENGNIADGRLAYFNITKFDYSIISTGSVLSNSGSSFTNTNPGNYVILSGTTDTSGNIYATYTGDTTKFKDNINVFNGAQFIATPAPEASQTVAMSVMLLGLGGLLAVARRRTAQS